MAQEGDYKQHSFLQSIHHKEKSIVDSVNGLQTLKQNLIPLSEKRIEPDIEDNNENNDLTFELTSCTQDGGLARVTLASSLSLLSRYCGGLPRDFYYDPKPYYEYITVNPLTGLPSQDKLGDHRFLCRCHLPNACPILEPIEGIRKPIYSAN